MTRQQITARLERAGYQQQGSFWTRPAERQKEHHDWSRYLTWFNAACEVVGQDNATETLFTGKPTH